jgi:hypothetical protein
MPGIELRHSVISSALGIALLAFLVFPGHAAAGERWTAARAQSWYAAQPWILGSNYVPYDAVNELEMWQAATFDPRRIDVELGWAQGLGMNTMRVFLHNLLWQQDPSGFKERIRVFLKIAARHHIKPVFVLFDSCWDPHPRLGPQHPPIPGVHNSGWVQAPGAAVLDDPNQYGRLQAYVKDVVGTFARDDRVRPGMSGTSPIIFSAVAAITRESRRTNCSASRHCCHRCSPGRAACTRSSLSPARSGMGLTGARPD